MRFFLKIAHAISIPWELEMAGTVMVLPRNGKSISKIDMLCSGQSECKH